MSVANRIRRQQILREAEGYLDLIYAFGEDGDLPAELRDRIAGRALGALSRLPDAAFQHAPAQYLKGLALRTMGRFAESIEPLSAAAAMEPNDIHVWLALGWCYKRMGRLDAAIHALEQAVAIAPGEALVRYNLACYWSLAGNAPQSLEYLSQAIEMEPGFRAMVGTEHDFDPIRHEPAFQALTSIIV